VYSARDGESAHGAAQRAGSPDHDLIVDGVHSGNPSDQILQAPERGGVGDPSSQRDELSAHLDRHSGQRSPGCGDRARHSLLQRSLVRIYRAVSFARFLLLRTAGTHGRVWLYGGLANDIFVATGFSTWVTRHTANLCSTGAMAGPANASRVPLHCAKSLIAL